MFPYIALCGWPKTGKSTIQALLQARYGYQPQDDGRVLREAAKIVYGLSDWHVYTQEGKASTVCVCGKDWQVRNLLGVLGERLEDMHGEYFIPEATLRACLAPYKDVSAPLMSFGSVRKSQPWFYRQKGGLVVGVRRAGITAPNNTFDLFDESAVQVWVDNPGDTLANFERVAQAALDPVLGAP